MRQVLFRPFLGFTSLPSNHCRFDISQSSSGSSSSLPKMNSAAAIEITNNLSHNYAPTSGAGSCSTSYCDGETQADESTKKRSLVSPNPILRHLGLLKPQNRSKSSCTTQQDPCTGLEATAWSQSKVSKTSDLVNNEKDSASPSCSVYSSLTNNQICDDRVSPSNALAQVDSDKVTSKLHHERDLVNVESNCLIEDDLHLWQSGTSNQNDFSFPSRFVKRRKSPTFRRKPALADSGQFKGRKWHSEYSPGKQHFTSKNIFDICDYTLKRSIEEEDGFITETLPRRQVFDEGHPLVLRPGMVLLKRYLSHNEQVSIVKECRELGFGPGGFYRPGYKDGAKLRLQMMCLGLDWDPQTRKYSKSRAIDKCRPPGIPHEFGNLVEKAIRYSQEVVAREFDSTDNVEDILPMMYTDICIVNFYDTAGRLGLHQDRDETPESIARGLPVVSFSIGDAAEFLYGEERRINRAEKVILESGDVLIFGGDSRLLFHGVQSIIPGSAPPALIEETGLRPGRLNLTFRQY